MAVRKVKTSSNRESIPIKKSRAVSKEENPNAKSVIIKKKPKTIKEESLSAKSEMKKVQEYKGENPPTEKTEMKQQSRIQTAEGWKRSQMKQRKLLKT